MIKFLNTDKLNVAIPRLFKEATKEIFIVVPYINPSDNVLTALQEADRKGVEINLVCQYETLKSETKKALTSFKNMTVFNHAFLHSKCYINERRIIITSINLLSHSEQNNREMGVEIAEFSDNWELEDWAEENEDNDEGYVSTKFYDNLIEEIQEILNSSEIVQKSSGHSKNGFKTILKTSKQNLAEQLIQFNKTFSPKRFEISKDHTWDESIVCKNFVDKFNLVVKDCFERIELIPIKGDIEFWEGKLNELHQNKFTITSKTKEYKFTSYVNSGCKINFVTYDLYDMEENQLLEVWGLVFNRISKYFTRERTKLPY